jgi:hypothetical protein
VRRGSPPGCPARRTPEQPPTRSAPRPGPPP